MKITTIGIDLAKQVFQVHGVDERGKSVVKKQLRRSQMLPFFTNPPVCLIGMEACGGAHHWARPLQTCGHTVKLMAPQYVKLYVKTNKNDAADAKAICGAAGRPNMRFVGIKTVEQQAVLNAHRARQGFVKACTAQVNQIRELLAEFGLVLPQGITHLAKGLPDLLKDGENTLPGSWRQLLAAIPDIGPLSASAFVATVVHGRSFTRGRQLAACLGMVPRQASSGGKTTLLGMNKSGDSYLRTLLIHGARSVVRQVERHPERADPWLRQLLRRRPKNVVAVALANKNARVAWALLKQGKDYHPPAVAGRP